MPFLRFSKSSSIRPLLGLVAIACAAGDVRAGESELSDLARAEVNRRANASAEAQQLLIKGDEAYEAGRYAEATEAYRGAVDLLPDNAPVVADQREAALQRFSQASVERARELRRLGDLEGANRALDAVLEDTVAPDDAAALSMREQLEDPIRTNPASSKEHSSDIEEVRLLLYKAQGAFDLGKYDQAHAVYEDVLRVDPYNSAARRGMERVAAARSLYHKAAYDQTRSDMLAMVDSQWETSVPPEVPLRVGGDFSGGGGVVDYIDKLESLTVPIVALEDVTLPEAVDFLRAQSIQLDSGEPDPAQRGINFVIDVGGPDSEIGKEIRSRAFSLSLRGATLSQLVDYVAKSTGTEAVRQPFAIVFRPVGADLGDLVARTYRVPPDFLTSSVFDEEGAQQANLDPFAPEQENEGLLARRLTAEEKLKKLGVPFPEGASAAFYSSSSTLQVRNTPVNHSLVEQIVETIANEEPTSVVVEVKLIRTQQEILEELGFDWVLAPFGLSANSTFLSGGTQGNGGDLGDVPIFPPVAFDGRPVTAGNRSGNSAISSNAIDQAILGRNAVSPDLRAPGILGLNGVFGDGQVAVLMRGLNQKTGTDLAAVPTVTTRSGQQASIEIMREFIYPTEYEPPELPNSVGTNAEGIYPVTPATPTAFEMRRVGVTLEVLPTASQDKSHVDISLKPEFTDFDGFVNYGSPILGGGGALGLGGLLGATEPQLITENAILMPVFSKSGTETALTVADGATIVIGGLLEERNENVEDKVPVLGDVPVVGRLFQTKSTAPVRRAIIFLVKVRVVDAAGRPFNP